MSDVTHVFTADGKCMNHENCEKCPLKKLCVESIFILEKLLPPQERLMKAMDIVIQETLLKDQNAEDDEKQESKE